MQPRNPATPQPAAMIAPEFDVVLTIGDVDVVVAIAIWEDIVPTLEVCGNIATTKSVTTAYSIGKRDIPCALRSNLNSVVSGHSTMIPACSLAYIAAGLLMQAVGGAFID